MVKLTFSTTGCWDNADGFGCASLGLPGVCSNEENCIVAFEEALRGVVLTGTYAEILEKASTVAEPVYAAIVVFGNAGEENAFLADLQKIHSCPMVGGGAAIDGASGRAGLIPGNGQAAVLLITDDRYTYEAVTENIHTEIISKCDLTFSDPRTLLTINGEDAESYLAGYRARFGLGENDFEHLTLSDLRNVNAHLSRGEGVIKSGRDLQEHMYLRYVRQETVYEKMSAFYDDENAIVFGCAGLSGLLDRPLAPAALGLFLFGEVCTVDGVAEFGNLMLSKLIIKKN